jgi:predicted flavoprotein YhiN
MNITHSEPFDAFVSRYGARAVIYPAAARAFSACRAARVDPRAGDRDFRRLVGAGFSQGHEGRAAVARLAAPLRESGVRFHVRHRWLGWNEAGALRFATPQGELTVQADAVVLALGGGSWAKLGSDGAWVPLLAQRGIEVAPLLPSNCGFDVAGGWSEHLKSRFAGQPLKTVALRFTDAAGRVHERRGELMLSDSGIEGSLVYALSAPLRDTIAAQGIGDGAARPGAGQTLERVGRSRPSARRAFLVQPPAKPRRHQGRENGAAARNPVGRATERPGASSPTR